MICSPPAHESFWIAYNASDDAGKKVVGYLWDGDWQWVSLLTHLKVRDLRPEAIDSLVQAGFAEIRQFRRGPAIRLIKLQDRHYVDG